MKKIGTVSVLILLSGLLSSAALAATVEGSVQGFTCVTLSKVCPLNEDDPLINMEKIFVVLTASNGYYFVPNITRDIMASFINQRFKVTGRINGKHKAIIAEKLYAWQNENWNLVLNLNSYRGK